MSKRSHCVLPDKRLVTLLIHYIVISGVGPRTVPHPCVVARVVGVTGPRQCTKGSEVTG